MGILTFGISNAANSYFTKSAFTSMEQSTSMMNKNNMQKYGVYTNDDVRAAYVLSNLLIAILIITGIIIGFVAVPHLCPDMSERGKNVRLGLFILLILTGGQLGWFFALLWLFKINICL